MKSDRLNLVIPKWLKDATRKAAEEKGVNMSEYIKDVLKSAVVNGTNRKNVIR